MAYTPMIQQYLNIKKDNPDCILFFRLGDFYEMFFEDAEISSKILEIALTSKDCGEGKKAPMCGIPYHALNGYLNKMITKGYKVAICEQLTDPKESKGIVERGIVRIVTPGTLVGDELQNEKINNYVLCANKHNSGYYISLCDVSTGSFLYDEFIGANAFNDMLREINGYEPTELLVEDDSLLSRALVSSNINRSFVKKQEYEIYKNLYYDKLHGDSNVNKGCITACGMLISYLLDTQKNSLEHIRKPERISQNAHMEIDANAKKHLELFETLVNDKRGSLLYHMDKTDTCIGGRLLRKWMNHPSIDLEIINSRHNAVEEVVSNPFLSAKLSELLCSVYDIERIISKLAYKTINARDCLNLKKSISVLPDIKQTLSNFHCKYFNKIFNTIDTMEDVYELLDKAINPEAPISVKEGDIINPDFNDELKELYDITFNSKEILLQLEAKEKEITDIKNLKLGYNKVFGYYLEVTKSYYDKVPYRYIRKQTLANCERYITEELKSIENKLTGANDKRIKLEYNIFEQIRNILIEQIARFQTASDCIAAIDCINALGTVAKDNGYIRPEMTTNGTLSIEQGKHPIVALAVNDSFVPNNTYLNTDNESFAIITGPNMSGKSTYMRQIALITIMAHMGSFVPAKAASISVTSKVFTRIGALDNLSQGQSTFMVEMSELAYIIENADKNSLIILDEIGRGTSTIDGVSIALAAVHYITSKISAKTLFATHYHQLSDLEGKINGVVNYKVAVSEKGEDVVFLHSIKRGGTDKSFGIYVAKLAGLPADFISMAQSIMHSQSQEDFNPEYNTQNIMETSNNDAIKEKYNKLINTIKDIDINNITPMDAMTLIMELQQQTKED